MVEKKLVKANTYDIPDMNFYVGYSIMAGKYKIIAQFNAFVDADRFYEIQIKVEPIIKWVILDNELKQHREFKG